MALNLVPLYTSHGLFLQGLASPVPFLVHLDSAGTISKFAFVEVLQLLVSKKMNPYLFIMTNLADGGFCSMTRP